MPSEQALENDDRQALLDLSDNRILGNMNLFSEEREVLEDLLDGIRVHLHTVIEQNFAAEFYNNQLK